MNTPRHLLDGRHDHNVGRRIQVAPGRTESVLDLAADDATACVLSVVLTVAPVVMDIDRLGPDELLLGADELYAEGAITLGSGGHQVSLWVDVLHGVALSVPASALRVSMTNRGRAAIEAGAFVTYGRSSERASLTFYGPELTVAPDAEWRLRVPPFATHIEVLGPVGAARQVEVGQGRAGRRWRYGRVARAGAPMAPVPIANGCGVVRITNPGGPVFSPVALFTLSL